MYPNLIIYNIELTFIIHVFSIEKKPNIRIVSLSGTRNKCSCSIVFSSIYTLGLPYILLHSLVLQCLLLFKIISCCVFIFHKETSIALKLSVLLDTFKYVSRSHFLYIYNGCVYLVDATLFLFFCCVLCRRHCLLNCSPLSCANIYPPKYWQF